MIRQKLGAIVSQAMAMAYASGQLAAISPQVLSLPVSFDRPRLPVHGDLSCSVAMQMAAQPDCGLTAMQLAQTLVVLIAENSAASGYFTSVQAVAPGFINFALGPRLAAQILVEIGRQGGRYGVPKDCEDGSEEDHKDDFADGYKDGPEDKRSALCYYLPQEPQELSLIEARQAVSVDCLARLLRFTGYKVDLSMSRNIRAVSRPGGLALLEGLGVDIAGAGSSRIAHPDNQPLNFPSAASALTLDHLQGLEKSLGAGILRYTLLTCQPDTWQSDLELAQKTGPCNPAFQVQSAYVRCCSLLRQATEERVNILSGTMEEPLMTLAQWQTFLLDYRAEEDMFLELFRSDVRSDIRADEIDNFSQSLQPQINLILKLADFPEEVCTAAHFKEPQRLARYVLDLANDFGLFYGQFNLGRGLFSSHLSALKARLGLIFATKQVFANALGIIGMSVPERM